MRLATVKPHRGRIYTPLRYPGGKSRLTGFLRHVISRGGWSGYTYAEPYAGGAGAALSLLINGTVARIAINDLDPAIHAFWRAAVQESDWFAERVLTVPLDLNEWHLQREIYQRRSPASDAELGFATFYLNRTNRSGVMNAGVIGGKAQSGAYRIDARFNRAELADRVRALGALRDKIDVTMEDGASFIARRLDDGQTFVYADPPYYEKGSYLYLNAFDDAMHRSLSTVLNSRPELPWVLTYDDAPEVRRLYAGRFQGTFELPYSAHRSAMFAERMIVSSIVARHIEDFTPSPG
jgi:DNA adenine methylase